LLTTAYGNSKRADTEQFQRLLVAAGFGAYLGSKGADGFFGAKTSDATKAYQASKGLSATGAADQATWDALRGTGAAAGAGAGTDPAKTASWQEGLGTFASGLAQGVAGMFTGGTAQAATGAGSMISPTTIGSSKKSMMPWVIGGVSILAVGGLVYYMSTKKGAGNRKGNRRGNGKGKGRSK
jgi:peptidoglycan hydrolase-like protein with peptidoglycan-binding domain